MGRAHPTVSTAKIAMPHVPPQQVHRPRLTAALDVARDNQVVLITAPAGYGKTLLAAEWRAAERHRTAWVSLDEGDNDDRRFWSALVAALLSCPSIPGDSRLRTLTLPDHPSRDPQFGTDLIAALGELPDPIRLVLDDLHEIVARDPLRGLAALIRDRPDSIGLVVLSRSDPLTLGLDRLRLAGSLVELRAQALAFGAEETSAMFAGAQIAVRPDQVELLIEQTEGWPAGLRLAALSMADADNPDEFLHDLVGNGRAISDYLVNEILARQPADLRRLLQAVSVCDAFSVPLAIALTGQLEAGELLDRLERETSLIVGYGIGRRWFRINPLLRAHLRVDLDRRRPDRSRALHAAAARWFEREQEPLLALRHARLAEDDEQSAALLRRQALILVTTGHLAELRSALELEPGRPGFDDPWLSLASAAAHLEIGELALADAQLARAVERWPADATPDLRALRVYVETRSGWLGGDLVGAGRSGQAGPPDVEPPPTGLDDGLAAAEMLEQASTAIAVGRMDDARAVVDAAVRRARAEGNRYVAARGISLQAMLTGLGGHYQRMLALTDEARALVADEEWHGTEGEAVTSMIRGYGLLLSARPQQCLAELEAAAGFAATLEPEAFGPRQAQIAAISGAADGDLGARDAGLRSLTRARRAVTESGGFHGQDAMIALFEHQAATALGRGEHAREVLGWAQQRFPDAGETALLRAWYPAQISRWEAARALLRPFLTGEIAGLVPWSVIDAWLLECAVALGGQQRERARTALTEALARSSEMGVRRSWLYVPTATVDLLADCIGSLRGLDPVAREILELRRTFAAVRPPTPLTAREQAVLDLLPTLRSLDQIADDLSVSVNTVKTHVRSIYDKLAVNSRRAAITTAEQRGLLVNTGNGRASVSP